MEARDPITESGARPAAGTPEKTAVIGGKEGKEEGPGVNKAEGSVSTADWGGYPRVLRGKGRPREWPIRSEAEPGAGDYVGGPSSGFRMNHRSAQPGIPTGRPRPRNCDATTLKRAMPLWL